MRRAKVPAGLVKVPRSAGAAAASAVAATTGNDPELDTLVLRLHTETACRRGGALALRHAGDHASGQVVIAG